MIRPLTCGLDSAILDEIIRVLKHVNLYIWGNWRAVTGYLDRFGDWDKYSTVLLSWHKTNPVPTCSNKYLNDTEYCLFVRERGVPLYGGYRDHSTYLTTPVNTHDKKLYGHPTIKPLDMIRTMVRNSSMPGDTVLDPFLGSGTTQVQAVLEGRNVIGAEINPDYRPVIEKRLNIINQRWLRMVTHRKEIENALNMFDRECTCAEVLSRIDTARWPRDERTRRTLVNKYLRVLESEGRQVHRLGDRQQFLWVAVGD